MIRATLAAIRPARRNLPLVGPPLVVALPAGARLVVPGLVVPGLVIPGLVVPGLVVPRLGISRLLVSRPVVSRLARTQLVGALRAGRGQRPGPLRHRGGRH